MISPYAKHNYISHQQSEFSSFVKFIEENWFTFSDPNTGTVTLPINGVPFPGPQVYPFTTSGYSAKPATILPGQTVTYAAKYTSPTNTQPTLAEVDIDGTAHALTCKGTNYSKGVPCSYSTTRLGIGIHYYRFRFDDGSGTETFEGGEKPIVTPIVSRCRKAVLIWHMVQ